jgi:hypothetical protein
MFCGVLLKLHSAMKLSLYILVKRKLFHVLLWLWYVLFFFAEFFVQIGPRQGKGITVSPREPNNL